MPQVSQLPVISSATDQTFFVVVDGLVTRRLNYDTLVTSIVESNIIGPPGPMGPFGPEGPSGPTGSDGVSGISGFSGYSGLNGAVAFSGYSGARGISGYSGARGISGYSSFSGYSGTSGFSGSSAGPGLKSRTTVSTSTIIIANGSTATTFVPGFKTYVLQKVTTNAAAWVVIYSDSASQIADISRTIGTDPNAGSGVIAEVITTSGSLTQLITPGVIGFNNDNPVTTSTYLKVTNNSGISQSINVTLTLLQLEN